MKTERIVYSPVITKNIPVQNDNTTDISKSGKTAKTAAMLTSALLAMAAIGKSEVKPVITISPYDLSYDSTNEIDKDWFRTYVNNYPDLKKFSRVDMNTLRVINEDDMVIDHIIKDGVHDTKVLGYADAPDLYPNGHDVPLAEQKYDDYDTYVQKIQTRKIIENCIKYGIPLSAGVLLTLLALNYIKKENADEMENKMEGYGSKSIEL